MFGVHGGDLLDIFGPAGARAICSVSPRSGCKDLSFKLAFNTCHGEQRESLGYSLRGYCCILYSTLVSFWIFGFWAAGLARWVVLS